MRIRPAPRQIAVVGPIASGKTTAARGLARLLGAQYVEADTFEENPFLEAYVKDIPRWALATELQFTHARVRRTRVIADRLAAGHVVVDSGLLMSVWVFARHHLAQGTMTPDEWALYETVARDLMADLPAPDAVVVLRASVETQVERIRRRGRAFEAGYTTEYLRRITDCCADLSDRLRSEGRPVVEVDTEREDLREEAPLGRLAAAVRRVAYILEGGGVTPPQAPPGSRD